MGFYYLKEEDIPLWKPAGQIDTVSVGLEQAHVPVYGTQLGGVEFLVQSWSCGAEAWVPVEEAS